MNLQPLDDENQFKINDIVKFNSHRFPYVIYAKYLGDRNKWDASVEILYNPRPDRSPKEGRGWVISRFKKDLILCTKEDILKLAILRMKEE